MKKTATKQKNSPNRKKLAPAQRKSWLRIYSHVAYFFSVLNLFLFPARVNATGVPAGALTLEQPPALAAPHVPRYGDTSWMEETGQRACSMRCCRVSAVEKSKMEKCRHCLPAFIFLPALTAPVADPVGRTPLASNFPQSPR